MDDLLKYVKDPGFFVEYNTKLISDDNVRIAIYMLVLFNDELNNELPHSNEKYIIDKLFDPNDKVIMWNGVEYVITYISDLFILSTYDRKYNNIHINYESPYRMVTKNTNLNLNIT